MRVPLFLRAGGGAGSGEVGRGGHGQGDVGVPGPVVADLVLIEAGLILRCLEALVTRPLPLLQDHDVADADQLVLEHSAAAQAQAGVVLFPRQVINLSFWSALMLEFDASCPIAGHDQRTCMAPLTSAEVYGDARLITRLPASGL